MLRFVAVLPLFFIGCAALSPAPKPPVLVAARTEPAVKSARTFAAVPLQNNVFLAGSALRSESIYLQLIKQLRSNDPAKRTCAATDLGYLRRDLKDLIPPLVQALKHDQSKWVRRAAAKSLGRIGTRDVILPLRQALNDRDRWVAHSAANALARLRA